MKTNRVILLLALLGVALIQTAQAFYNPSNGRWLSRDPIEEDGFLIQYFLTISLLERSSILQEETPAAGIYLFVQNDAIQSFDLLGLCKVVGPIKADSGINFGYGDLFSHKWNRKNPPAKVIWTMPCGPWQYIVNIRIIKKPTTGSGGEAIINGGVDAEMSVETRYAILHSASDGTAASVAEFDCCCGPTK